VHKNKGGDIGWLDGPLFSCTELDRTLWIFLKNRGIDWVVSWISSSG